MLDIEDDVRERFESRYGYTDPPYFITLPLTVLIIYITIEIFKTLSDK